MKGPEKEAGRRCGSREGSAVADPGDRHTKGGVLKSIARKMFGTSHSASSSTLSAAEAEEREGSPAARWASTSHLPVQHASGPPARSPGASSPSLPFRTGTIFPIIPGKLSFVCHRDDKHTQKHIDQLPDKFFFSADFQERYEPFCADFGPVNLSVVHNFCIFFSEYWTHPSLVGRELVYYTAEAVDVRTNCAFLIAAFLVIHLKQSPEEAWRPFGAISGDAFATFRDATFCTQDYKLTILACLQGISKAMSLGWYDPKTFDTEDYEYLDHPSNADMHVLSPKFVAFKGPSPKRKQLAPGVFTFTPRHYVDVFKDKGVTAVVRLNEPTTYEASGFIDEGIQHYDLYFDDCTVPTPQLVERFLEIAEGEEGLVAVHCKAGLGRTGTLIAIHFMKHNQFTASECIGWLRVVRPGSIIGPQQQYLHDAERIWGTRPPGSRPSSEERARPRSVLEAMPEPPTAAAAKMTLEESEALGKQVADAQIARAKARGAAGRGAA